jgi:hypothetical protein
LLLLLLLSPVQPHGVPPSLQSDTVTVLSIVEQCCCCCCCCLRLCLEEWLLLLLMQLLLLSPVQPPDAPALLAVQVRHLQQQ